MIDRERLAEPMIGEHCAAELFEERHRDALCDACAEDPDADVLVGTPTSGSG